MKRYNEYTQTELAEVTSEKLEQLIDLEIAYEGILPVECPEPLPTFDSGIKPTETAYEVFGILLKKQEDAITVAKLSVVTSDYDYYGAGSKFEWLKEKEDYYKGIKPKEFYKKEDVNKIKQALTDRKRQEEQYSKDEAKYDNYAKSISTIRESVYSAYYDANDFKKSVDKAKRMYQKYLDLAEQNTDIAKKFFLDAYKSSPAVANTIFPGLVSVEGVTND